MPLDPVVLARLSFTIPNGGHEASGATFSEMEQVSQVGRSRAGSVHNRHTIEDTGNADMSLWHGLGHFGRFSRCDTIRRRLFADGQIGA